MYSVSPAELMARRRRRKKTRTRRNTGFNIRSALFAYANLHVVTKAVTNVGPWTFLTDGYLTTAQGSVGHGTNIITLKEIFAGQHLSPQFASDTAMTYTGTGPSGEGGLGSAVQANLMNNGAPAIIALIGLKVLDKGLQKVGVYRNFNKIIKDTGMKGTVKA